MEEPGEVMTRSSSFPRIADDVVARYRRTEPAAPHTLADAWVIADTPPASPNSPAASPSNPTGRRLVPSHSPTLPIPTSSRLLVLSSRVFRVQPPAARCGISAGAHSSLTIRTRRAFSYDALVPGSRTRTVAPPILPGCRSPPRMALHRRPTTTGRRVPRVVHRPRAGSGRRAARRPPTSSTTPATINPTPP